MGRKWQRPWREYLYSVYFQRNQTEVLSSVKNWKGRVQTSKRPAFSRERTQGSRRFYADKGRSNAFSLSSLQKDTAIVGPIVDLTYILRAGPVLYWQITTAFIPQKICTSFLSPFQLLAWDGLGKKERYLTSHRSPWLTCLYKAIQYFYVTYLFFLLCCKNHGYDRERYFYTACLIFSFISLQRRKQKHGKEDLFFFKCLLSYTSHARGFAVFLVLSFELGNVGASVITNFLMTI